MVDAIKTLSTSNTQPQTTPLTQPVNNVKTFGPYPYQQAPTGQVQVAAPSSSSQLYNQYRNVLGQPQLLGNDPTLTAAPTQINGLGEDYFNQQRDMLKERLRQDFFGPVGTLQQVASGESAAGRLGSGVSKYVIQQAALDPFARASTDLDTQYAGLFQQEKGRVEQFNAEQQNQYMDRLAKLRAGDQSVLADFNKMALDAADAEAGRLSQQSIAQLEADLRIYEAALKDEQARRMADIETQRNAIQYIGTAIDPDTSTPAQNSLAQAFGGQFGGSSGTGTYYNPALPQYMQPKYNG